MRCGPARGSSVTWGWRLGVAIAVVVLAALPAADLVLAYVGMPHSALRYAYSLGIRVGLDGDNLSDIAAGKKPVIRFKGPKGGDANLYLWQSAKLVRLGDCLEVPLTPTVTEHCRAIHQSEPDATRLVFKKDVDGALHIGVHDKPLLADQFEARGALHEVEGEIAIGNDFDTASRFHVEVEGWQVGTGSNVDAASKALGDCRPPIALQPMHPVALRLHGPFRIQSCIVRSKDQKEMLLVLYQRSVIQSLRWLEAILCRGLVLAIVENVPRSGLAACLDAYWSEIGKHDVGLTLLRKLGDERFELIH
jgi:hypothetical protein